MKRITSALIALAIALAPAPAFAWGATGHELVSGIAVDMLSKDVPAFLKTKIARFQIALLGREPDRSRGAGKTHDWERDPAHYINIGDDGLAEGVFSLDNLPVGRSDFDAAYRLKDIKPPAPGYLPYAIIDGWQQIVKDFGYWRASKVAARNAKTKTDRAWFKADMQLREMILIRDIGVWSHFVADGSQPQHVSSHHNGWEGVFTDPMTYPPPGQPAEIRGLHAYFEGPFVKANIKASDIRAAMTPYRDCACSIEQRTPAYLKATLTQLRPLYELVQAGGIRDVSPAAKTFTTLRLAAGASEVRDMIEDAWKASATSTVGYPNINVADVESGKVILSRDSYGAD
jgi:hypothetical protein